MAKIWFDFKRWLLCGLGVHDWRVFYKGPGDETQDVCVRCGRWLDAGP